MSAAEQCDFWPSIGRLGVTEVARLTSADSSSNRSSDGVERYRGGVGILGRGELNQRL